jgi:hypothetical protein
MLTFLLVTASLFALAAPRNRFGFTLLILVIFAGIAGNIENPDRAYYLANFDGIRSGGQDSSFEPGYQTLARLASSIELDYGAFHFVLTATALLLITRTVIDLTSRPSLALLAYISFPFFWDVTQIRNFYAMAIVLYSMKYLLIEQRASTVKYIISILCASLFHITSLFYLLFLLTRLRNKVLLWGGLGVGVASYLYLFSAIVASPLFAFIGNKIDVYTTTETSIVTKAAVLAFYVTSLAALWWASRRVLTAARYESARCKLSFSSPSTADKHKLNLKISPTILLNVNLVAGLSILLALDNLDFIRLFRNIFLINCIFIINGIHSRPQYRRILTFCFVLYLVATFIGFVFLTSTSNIIENTLLYNVINY